MDQVVSLKVLETVLPEFCWRIEELVQKRKSAELASCKTLETDQS